MKNILTTTLIVVSLLASVAVANANEQICTQSYGQPVVCTTKTPVPVHTPVQAGIEDINPLFIGFTALFAGLFVYFKSKKASI